MAFRGPKGRDSYPGIIPTNLPLEPVITVEELLGIIFIVFGIFENAAIEFGFVFGVRALFVSGVMLHT